MLNISQIRELAAGEAAPCISLYLSTHRTWPETRKDRIRLKNLIGEAHEQLLQQGLRPHEANELLAEARTQLDDEAFWRYQSEGLAVFITPKGTRWLHLPMSVAEEAHVGVRFHIKPLLPSIAANGRFYVLTISQDEVRLYEGNQKGLCRVRADDLPESIATEGRFTQYQQKTGFHPTGPSPTTHGEPSAMHHAGGEAPEDVRENVLMEWLKQVAKGTESWLDDETAPLVLVADERNFGHFQTFCAYPRLLKEGLRQHPESLSESEIHEKAWALVEPEFARRVGEARQRFQALAGDGDRRAPHEVTEIVGAAKFGQVETLFVAKDAAVRGTMDPETGKGTVEDDDTPDNEDLLDRAAAEALMTGAEVFVLPQHSIPDERAAAAILRY